MIKLVGKPDAVDAKTLRSKSVMNFASLVSQNSEGRPKEKDGSVVHFPGKGIFLWWLSTPAIKKSGDISSM